MLHSIITQTREIVNCAHIISITPLPLTYEGADVYAIIAKPVGVSEISDETLDKCIQLGVYDSEDKMVTVYESLLKWFDNTIQPTFAFPADVEE